MTLNTWKCDGDYSERMSRLESEMSSLSPDLLLLQEVFAAPELGEDTARRVADCLPAHELVLAPARKKSRRFMEKDAMSTSGLAVLVRGQVLNSTVVQLPDTQADRDRIAQIVDIEMAGLRFQIVNLHLTHIRVDAELRKIQLETIFNQLGPGPLVLGGDFNDLIDSPALSYLATVVDRVLLSREPTHGDHVIDYLAWRDLGFAEFEASVLFNGENSPLVSDHAAVAVRFKNGL